MPVAGDGYRNRSINGSATLERRNEGACGRGRKPFVRGGIPLRLMREVFLMTDNPSGLAARERRRDLEARMNAAMERYASGDLAAFPELYAGMLPQLTRYLKAIVTRVHFDRRPNPAHMKLHRARAKWRTGSRVEPYLFMIARNAAIECAGTFTSRDYRLGIAIGKALGRIAAPFAVARYFGAGTNC
jgi:hypothetical protein